MANIAMAGRRPIIRPAIAVRLVSQSRFRGVGMVG
jgi:hypothetical protein